MNVQENRQQKKPNPTIEFVSEILCANWKLSKPSDVKRIDSYDDANFYVLADGISYLLKVYNSYDSQQTDILHAISFMLQKISAYKNCVTVPVPVKIPNESCDLIFAEKCLLMDESHGKVAVRLFHWVHGNILQGCIITPTIQAEIGLALGNVFIALQGFDATSFHRTHMWDLAQFDLSYSTLLQYVDDPSLQSTISAVYNYHQEKVVPIATASFERSVIMADCNDANIIVSPVDEADPSTITVTGLIDFSDAVYTWSVNELAIALAYNLLSPFAIEQPLLSTGSLLLGYLAARGEAHSLSDDELRCLLPLVAVRLSISILVGSYSAWKEPENAYLNVHARPARNALKFIWELWTQDEVSVCRFLFAVRNLKADSALDGGFERIGELILKIVNETFLNANVLKVN